MCFCAYVKNKDTRTEEHKANALKLNKIKIYLSALYVFLSKPFQARVFFRGDNLLQKVVVPTIE